MQGRCDAVSLRKEGGKLSQFARKVGSCLDASASPVWRGDRVGRHSQDKHQQTAWRAGEGIYTEGTKLISQKVLSTSFEKVDSQKLLCVK